MNWNNRGRQPLYSLAWIGALAGWLVVAVPVRGAEPFVPEGPVITGFHTLQGMTEAEARMIAEPMLSPTGRFGYMASRSRVILYDTRDRVEAIKRALEQNDFSPVNLQIHVFSNASGESSARGLGVDHVRVQVDPDGDMRGSASVHAHDTRTTTQDKSSQFITTTSGKPARIWVGSTVAEPQWVFEYGYGHGWWRQDTVWQEIGASLWVLPRLLGNGTVEVELYPRITMRGTANQAGSHDLDVRELSTTVIATPGQLVPLGGLDENRRAVYSRLLGRDSVFNGESFDISLQVTVLGAPQVAPPIRPP